MTREENYLAGKAEGERWAEEDVLNGRRLEMLNLTRGEATLACEARKLGPAHDSYAAYLLGRARGYREIARTFERGRWGS